MQHNDEKSLAEAGLLFYNFLSTFSASDKKQLEDWFESYKKKSFEKADKTQSSNYQFSEKQFIGFLDYLRHTNNLTNCSYQDLCQFSRTLTLVSYQLQLTVALISAILNKESKLLGHHADLFFDPNSPFSQAIQKCFSEVAHKPSKILDAETKEEASTPKNISDSSSRPPAPSLPPRHPGESSYFHHYDPKSSADKIVITNKQTFKK